MKAYLKPEDEQECLRMIKSLDMALAIWDFDQWLRGEYKYHDKEYCYEIRQELHRCLDKHNINLDELTT